MHTEVTDQDRSELALHRAVSDLADALKPYSTDIRASEWKEGEIGSPQLLLALEIQGPLDMHLHQKDGFVRMALYLRPKA